MKNLDYRKDFRHLYIPPAEPVLVDVPPAMFAVVRGRGNPNDNPEFQASAQDRSREAED